MMVSKRVISIVLIGMLSLGTLTGCNNIGKSTPNQLVMIDDYRNTVNDYIDSLGSFMPELERLFDNSLGIVTMSNKSDMIDLSKEMRTELNKVWLLETPKAFEESNKMFESGLILISNVVDDMEEPDKNFNTTEELDEALYKLGDGMQEMTEAMKYRTENEMDY